MKELLPAAVLFLLALPPLAWLLQGASRLVDGAAPPKANPTPATLSFSPALLVAGCGAAAFAVVCASSHFVDLGWAVPAAWGAQAAALSAVQPASPPRAATVAGMTTFAALATGWLLARIAEGLVSLGVG